MSLSFNPFTVLLDPVGILTTCAKSGVLDAMPLSAKRSADRQSPRVAGELAEHDAAVDAIYHELIAKAARAATKPATKSNSTKSKSTRSAEAA